MGGYELLTRLGEGGMGVVHLARRPGGDRVALKVLRPAIIGDTEARARLAQEVGSLSRIKSHRVAEIIDADPWGDIPYVATRYVPGLSLHEQVEQEGPILGTDLHWFARCLAEALSAVHAVGVLHRDIKPSNILMEGRSPVLIDFGLARLADDPRLTHQGWLLGTPGYLAPEILYGDDASPASDVHAWAATVAFAGSGTPPFGRGPSVAVMDRVRRGEYSLAGIEEPIASLLREALAPDPLDRPTLRELREWLDRDDQVTALHQVRPPVAATSDPSQLTVPLVAAGGAGPGGVAAVEPPTLAEPEHRPDPAPALVAPDQEWDAVGSTDWSAPSEYRTRPLQTAVLAEGEDETRWLGTDDAPVQGRPPAGERFRAAVLNLAAAGVVGAATALAPVVTLVLVALLVWLVRSGSMAGSARADRRQVRGAKWYDGVQTLVSTPVHLVRALPGSVLLLGWSLGVAAAAALLCYAVALGVLPGLAVSGTVLGLGLWFGPGAERWSGPVGRVVRPTAARPVLWLLSVVVLVAAASGLLAAAKSSGTEWAPWQQAPLSVLR